MGKKCFSHPQVSPKPKDENPKYSKQPRPDGEDSVRDSSFQPVFVHRNLPGYTGISSTVMSKTPLLSPDLLFSVCKQNTLVLNKNMSESSRFTLLQWSTWSKSKDRARVAENSLMLQKLMQCKIPQYWTRWASPLQPWLWALASTCYSLYFIYPSFLHYPMGRVPVLFGYCD